MKGFAVRENRLIKAKKVESVINNYFKKEVSGLRILDIGAGDGTISSYFMSLGNKVVCVDIEDQRTEKGPKFVQANSAKLPLQSNQFDVVISNHVIEHIENQELHLKEIRRVLKKNGICYLATPNWNFPVEPHYKIPLLHYLPQTIFNGVLKSFRLYKENIYLLSYRNMKKKFDGFKIKEYTSEVIKNHKQYGMKGNLVSQLPIEIIKAMEFISPTNIFILKK